MMFKKNKKKYENCVKCGKPLSTKEIQEGVSKCENCRGKIIIKMKKIFSIAGFATTIGAFIGYEYKKHQQ